MIHKFRFLFILVPIAFITAATFATMGLWNWLMPSFFGVGTLTFLKALGIFALARLFFGGRGFGGWRHRRLAFAGHYNPQHQAEWLQRMHDKWQNLSPEQRTKFSSYCGGRFNFNTETKGTETKSENTNA
jgi:hypothetical protein